MKILDLLYVSLVNPRRGVYETVYRYDNVHFVCGLIILALATLSSIAGYGVMGSPVSGVGYYIPLCLSDVAVHLAVLVFLSFLLHGLFGVFGKRGNVLSLITGLMISNVPFAYLACFSMISQALVKLSDNHVLGNTFFLVSQFVVILCFIAMIVDTIRLNYQFENATQAFVALLIGVFISILSLMMVFGGMFFSGLLRLL
ncbi:hypothetical protein MJH12_13975 [bacterium]|nr:hypothetical protein [bacterium]